MLGRWIIISSFFSSVFFSFREYEYWFRRRCVCFCFSFFRYLFSFVFIFQRSADAAFVLHFAHLCWRPILSGCPTEFGYVHTQAAIIVQRLRRRRAYVSFFSFLSFGGSDEFADCVYVDIWTLFTSWLPFSWSSYGCVVRNKHKSQAIMLRDSVQWAHHINAYVLEFFLSTETRMDT